MSGYTFAITDVPDPEVRIAIGGALKQFNETQVGPNQRHPLVVVVRDKAGAAVGGLWGMTEHGWLFTELLFIPADLRGQGIGTRVMEMAEREGISRGCHSAWLDTFEWQARPFYERIGYECFGELPDYPVGFSRFFMKKSLGLRSNQR